jgi:hypothetical protein
VADLVLVLDLAGVQMPILRRDDVQHGSSFAMARRSKRSMLMKGDYQF